jgi:tripartite-type tricarboxylate transporter receptor subunit TctC
LDAAGVNITHIPFRGGTGPMTELLAGRVDVMVDTMTLVASLLKDQRVRALAVTSPAGASNLSGAPAVADVLPGVVFESWLGIAAPAGTPPDIVDKLNQSLRAVLEQTVVRQKLIDLGGSPRASSPVEFQTRVERDIENLRKVVALRRMELE